MAVVGTNGNGDRKAFVTEQLHDQNRYGCPHTREELGFQRGKG